MHRLLQPVVKVDVKLEPYKLYEALKNEIFPSLCALALRLYELAVLLLDDLCMPGRDSCKKNIGQIVFSHLSTLWLDVF